MTPPGGGREGPVGEVFLGRYEVEREVGQGGMAVVYRGTDHVLGRPVAIKVLHGHLLQKEEARARFAREARVIARLKHPGIVEVYDYSGAESDRSFLVAEFVDGDSLAEVSARTGAMPPEIAALVAASVGDALAHAHERGVVHRDVKPENLMVRRDGVLKLMDFGIAHVLDMEHLTMTGAILGSPAHMSPEQVDGRALDARTDVFSLGTLLYLLATGRYPFQAETPSAMLRAIVEVRYPDPRQVRAGFPDDLCAVLSRMMARDPADRYPTAREAVDALLGVTSALGFGPPSAELPRYFADPVAVGVEVSGRVAEARLKRAREHLAKRRPALAMREADAVLALRPDDPDARRVLDRARSSVRRRRVSRGFLALLGACGLLCGAVVLVVSAWPRDEVSMPTPPDVAPAPVAATPGPAAAPEAAAPSLSPSLPAPAATAPRTAPAPSSPHPGAAADREASARASAPAVNGTGAKGARGPVLVPLSIQAHPPAVRIEVDGRVVGEGRVDGLALTPGTHVVRLTHPSCEGCRDVEQTVTLDPATPPRGPLRMSIAYRDAVLFVSGPAGGRVFVNDETRPRGRTNEAIALGMAAPGPVPVKVRVEGDGREPRVLRVPLSAGRTSTVPLD
jgi:eukaryotic-like serine/threonine-protein kinase